jgi:Flp pilus assembly protein TadG
MPFTPDLNGCPLLFARYRTRIGQKFQMDTHETIEPGSRGLMARLGRCFRRFGGNRDGSTAIEFTMLAIPFSLLVFAILESCISFAAQEVMANATDDVARRLRTGQLLAATVTKDSLKKEICDRMAVMVATGCTDALIVDLRKYDTFADAAAVTVKITASKQIDETGFDVKPGGALTKNMLRVFYPWPVMTDFMSKAMSNLADGKTLHFASITWQNEPFDE